METEGRQHDPDVVAPLPLDDGRQGVAACVQALRASGRKHTQECFRVSKKPGWNGMITSPRSQKSIALKIMARSHTGSDRVPVTFAEAN